LLIAIEGADAVGKNEQSRRLTDALSATKQTCRLSFPRYDTTVGGAILRHLKEETRLVDTTKASSWDNNPLPLSVDDPLMFQCMMLADKVHAAASIRSMLAGGHVVLDRWWQSAYVYGSCDGLDETWLLQTHEFLPQADLNILLTLPVEESQNRRPGLRDRYEKDVVKQVRIREKYIELWKQMIARSPKNDWVIVDSNKTRDEVFEQIMQRVRATASRLKMDLA
jgi:thymidylate kinase